MEKASKDFGMVERLLEPIARALSVDVARKLAAIRADDETQQFLEDLADRNAAGELSAEERDQYEALVGVSNFIAILQAQARRVMLRER